VIIAELVVYGLITFISKNIIDLDITNLGFGIIGAIVAFFVSVFYDRILNKKKKKAERELKELTDVALKRHEEEIENKEYKHK